MKKTVNGGNSGHSESTSSTAEEISREPNPIRKFLKILGPGLITGASDDDPSGIGTYVIAGASLGVSILWTALVTFPLMAAVQFICAKIGLVTKTGLAGILEKHYSRAILYPVLAGLFIANTINAGADIGAVAAALNLLAPVPIPVFIIPVALLILVVQIWGSYELITRIFKWLTLALLAYIGSAFFARPDLAAVLKGTFVPSFKMEKEYVTTFVAIVGTTISPYLFFWQTGQEVEEKKIQGRGNGQRWRRRGASQTELDYAALDVNTGMFFSNLVMYFIILASAATLHKAGGGEVQSAADAALALRPFLGPAAEYLFALGLIGAGFLAIPILTGSASYALAEALGWQRGLDEKPHRAKGFYVTIAASTIAGMLLNFLNINPIKALFWTSVINGVLAPPLLVIIMLISNDKRIMGNDVNGGWVNVLGWLTAGVMAVAAVTMIFAS